MSLLKTKKLSLSYALGWAYAAQWWKNDFEGLLILAERHCKRRGEKFSRQMFCTGWRNQRMQKGN